MATTLLIVDFVFSFNYDVICSKFDSLISFLISDDVRQVCLEDGFFLSFVDQLSSEVVLPRGHLLIVRGERCQRQIISEFQEATLAVFFTAFTVQACVVRHLFHYCFFAIFERVAFFVVELDQVLGNIIA